MRRYKSKCIRKLFFLYISTIFIICACGITTLHAQYTKEWYSNNHKILTSLYNGEFGYFEHVPEIDTNYFNFAKTKLNLNYSTLISITQAYQSRINNDLKLNKDSLTEEQIVTNRINETIKENDLLNKLENLYYYTDIYDSIKEYTVVLEPILSKSIFEDKAKSEKLFALYGLLDINNSKKSELIQLDKIPLYVKGKLCDSYSLNLFKEKLVKTLNDSLFSDQLENMLIQMFYIDSQELWDIYFSNLQSIHYYKYYYNCNQKEVCKREWSLAYLLLKAYKKYYPFEMEYFEKYIFNNPIIPDNRETIVYFLAVSKYLENKYNRHINIKTYFMGRENYAR